MTSADRQVRTDAPDAPDARVLALDIGVYGHRGSITSMFWYQRGGGLHTHVAELLPAEATVLDQLDVLEALAESYPEYWRISPVVVVGVTVLSNVGKQQVRSHLSSWYNPPWRRRLVAVGDYAGEQAGTGRALVTRKKLRDLIAERLTARTVTLTAAQHDAVANYTGRRQRPGRDSDDEWRSDDTDALAVPVGLACLAAHVLLPRPLPGPEEHHRWLLRVQRAWQLALGLPDDEAWDQARRRGHPHATSPAAAPEETLVFRRPDPSTPIRGTHTGTS